MLQSFVFCAIKRQQLKIKCKKSSATVICWSYIYILYLSVILLCKSNSPINEKEFCMLIIYCNTALQTKNPWFSLLCSFIHDGIMQYSLFFFYFYNKEKSIIFCKFIFLLKQTYIYKRWYWSIWWTHCIAMCCVTINKNPNKYSMFCLINWNQPDQVIIKNSKTRL